MPNPEPRSVYWDACVFLEAINADQTALALAHAKDIKTLLEEAEAGRLRIYTSVLSKVEVSHSAAEAEADKLSPETERKIAQLFAPESSPVIVLDFHDLIADDARRLSRQGVEKGWGLKAADAIHLATAKRQGVGEFHTYDPKLTKYGPLVGLTVCEPEPVQRKLDLGG